MTKSEEKQFYSKLGSRIRVARQNATMKQETFASFIKLSRSSVVNIEKGRQRIPIHSLCEVARILNVPIMTLLPEFKTRQKLDSTWKTIIESQIQANTESKEKNTQIKVTHFIEELQSDKKKS